MKKTTAMSSSLILISFLAQGLAGAAPSHGRIVVFADVKEGEFKTDKSIRNGTNDNLEGLKVVGTNGVHACFIGTPEDVKPILAGMIANANKTSKQDDLKLNSFETDKNSPSIKLEVTSGTDKSVYLQMKIDPC